MQTFIGYGEDKKCRLEIRPDPGLDPPKLPKWLRIPFLKPRKGILEPPLILEKNTITRLQPGDGLWHQGLDGREVDNSTGAAGTLGPIIESDDGKYFVLTAGHVLPDGDRTLVVKSDDGELAANLEVVERSLRIQGRPKGRVKDGSEIGFEDEVVSVLKINDQDSHKFNEFLYCLNCHHFGPLVSNPTRTFVCAANCLYFLCSLGNLSAASLLARDGGACAARPGLVAEKGEPPRTPSIYATDTWSGRMGEAKYKRRDANDNKRGCKVKHAKCEMRGAKCEVRNGSSDCNCECGCDAFLYPSPTFLISSFFPSPTSVSPSQLGALRNAPGDVRMATLLGVLRIAHGDVRMATQLGFG